MKQNFPTEFVFQVTSLILIAIVIQILYSGHIRPTAFEILEAQEIRMSQDPYYVPERSVYVLVRDFEQQVCFILMFWAFGIMGFKAQRTIRERALHEQDLVNVPEGMRILPEDTRDYARNIQALPPDQRPHPRTPQPEGARATAAADLLRVLLKACCDKHDVAPKLIASSSDLDRLSAGERDGVPALAGWRREIFGQHAIDLIEGRLALTYRDGEIAWLHAENAG